MRSSRLGDLCLEGGDFALEICLCVLGDMCQGYLSIDLRLLQRKMGVATGLWGDVRWADWFGGGEGV